MISFITTENGRIGETRFARHEQQLSTDLKKRALSELYSSEILEWYRQQYNIPLDVFYKKNIDEDVAFVDFYRRQFWNELRYGIRDWGDESPALKMPQFTLFRPFGGVLPAPNGFNVDTSYTSKIEHYNMSESSKKSSEEDSSATNSYTLEKTSSKTKTSLPMEDVEEKYKIPEKEFETMLDEMQNNESFWETLDELGSLTNG